MGIGDNESFTLNSIRYDDNMRYGKLQDGDIPLIFRITKDIVLGIPNPKKSYYRNKKNKVSQEIVTEMTEQKYWAKLIIMQEIIRQLDELCGEYRKLDQSLIKSLLYDFPKVRYFSHKFIDK